MDKPMNCLKLLLPLLALTYALPAPADIYKCRLPNGQAEISNTPCSAGNTLKTRPDENVSEADRQQAERDLERMRGYVEKREAAQRADAAGEYERLRLQAGQRSASRSAYGNYSNADECLRDVSQMVLNATQRALQEADCRQLPPREPSIVGSPYPIAVPTYYAPPLPPHPPKPPKKREPEQEAPRMSILPRR